MGLYLLAWLTTCSPAQRRQTQGWCSVDDYESLHRFRSSHRLRSVHHNWCRYVEAERRLVFPQVYAQVGEESDALRPRWVVPRSDSKAGHVGRSSVHQGQSSSFFLLSRVAQRSLAMIRYEKKAEWMASIRRNGYWYMDNLQVSSPRWHYVRDLCEAVRTAGSGGVAQVAREFGSAGFGRRRIALGEIASTGSVPERATCKMQKNLV